MVKENPNLSWILGKVGIQEKEKEKNGKDNPNVRNSVFKQM